MERNIGPSNEVTDRGDWRSALEPILRSPDSSALFFDLDGTLASIMPSPSDVVLPKGVKGSLSSITGKYRLVACVSGRNAGVAKKIVGLDGITYIGCHGLELIRAGSKQVETMAGVEEYATAVNSFVQKHFTEDLREVEVGLEDKGSIQVFHIRCVKDHALAEQRLHAVAEAAQDVGLIAQWGRKVLEIRPPIDANKGTAITALLEGKPVKLALYAGDDRTDLDAFRALRDLESKDMLEGAVCVGVSSSEGPDEISGMADIVVSGTLDVARLLDVLGNGETG